MTKRKIMFTLATIVFVISLAVFSYPYILQFIFNSNINDEISDFEQYFKSSEKNNPGFLDELYEQMKAYNQQIYESKQNGLTDPFAYEQPSFGLLQLGFEKPEIGYIEIKKINLKLPIYLGASQDNLKKGSAQLSQTSLPIGGINTNAVIAGHRGTVQCKMFRDIVELEPGDEVEIVNFRESLIYKVESTKVIMPDDIDDIKIQENRDMVTLSTCYYVDSKTANRRFLVYCMRTEN